MNTSANHKLRQLATAVIQARRISAAPLLAAIAMFIVGLWGLIVVAPYTPPAPLESFFVVRPSAPPEAQPSPDAVTWINERGLAVASVESAGEPTVDAVSSVDEDEVEANVGAEAPEEPAAPPVSNAGSAAVVTGAGGTSSPVGEVSQPASPTPPPPPPTPTATPPTVAPTATQTAVPQPTPTATPEPDPTPASSRPVAAFLDPDLQQPTPASSYTSDESHPVHQPDSATVSGSSVSSPSSVVEQGSPTPGADGENAQSRKATNGASGKNGNSNGNSGGNSSAARNGGGSASAKANNQGPPAHAASR